jgi:ribokinase
VAAARLGAPVALVTVLGDDERARWWRRRLTEEGVDVRWVLERPGPTDVGVVLLTQTKVPAIVSVADISQELTAEAVDEACAAIAGASIVLGVLESPQAGIQRAFEHANEVQALTVLVPSPPTQLDRGLIEATQMVVCNEHEAAALTGRGDRPATLAASLQERTGARIAIVTAGAHGAFLRSREGADLHVPAQAVDQVLDTTGAGDAFVGGLVVALRNDADLTTAVRFAASVAAYSVAGESTISSFPTRAALRALGTDVPGSKG